MRSLINVILIVIAASDNACNDADKVKIGGSLFPGFLWHCGLKALVDPSKIGPCLVEGCGLTKGCAGCFSDSGKCVFEHCLSQCTTPSDPACKPCMDENCNPTLLKCTGRSSPIPAPQKPEDKCSSTPKFLS